MKKCYIGFAEVGDMIIYTLNDCESLEVGFVTEKKYSDFWGVDLILVDGSIIFFKHDGSHHGGSDSEYAVQVIRQWKVNRSLNLV